MLFAQFCTPQSQDLSKPAATEELYVNPNPSTEKEEGLAKETVSLASHLLYQGALSSRQRDN